MGAIISLGLVATAVRAAGVPVFHLNFAEFRDISGNNLVIEVGDAVSLVPGGGPTLANGTKLDAGRWDGVDDDTNQIIIFDNPILDAVSISAGSIVSWIKVEDDTEWNNIAKTPCPDHVEPCDAFSQFLGIEFQASQHAGVFGSAQGWLTNVFGPNAPQNGGPGTETPSGVWTHAALTWNLDGDHTIYVNGEPGPTVVGVGNDPFGLNEPGDWTIGGDGLGSGGAHTDATRRLRGDLADFAIFNGELTEAEIQEIMRAGVPSSAAPRLQAGDSDMDLDFDQLDLVRVQIAAKYLTGRAATWGEGDWNGAPGGSQGNPPAGDGRFDQLDIVSALAPGHYLAGPYAAIGANGIRGDGQTSLVYNPGTGELAVDAPAGTQLTSINIDSASGIFTGQPAQNLGGSFDNDSDTNIFKATFGSSFGSLSFGNVAARGLAQALVQGDLTVVGSLAGGGALGNVDLIYIPEPATGLLLVLGLACLMATSCVIGRQPREPRLDGE
jgi:hypothetical protein